MPSSMGVAGHGATTVVAHRNRVAAVAVSNCDTRPHPSPPPLLIAIAPPSRCPLRCCRICPSRLLRHHTTLRHLLTHRRPSTCRLVVTLGWLSSLHLLSCHCLNVPAGCHVASQCATLSFAPAGCHICRHHRLSTRCLKAALPLIALPSRSSRLVVASPLVTTPLLNTLAGCTLPLIVPPSGLTRLVVVSPLIATTVTHCNRTAILLSM